MSKLLLIRITCPSRRVAEDIADAALEGRLAACANLEGPVTSSYRWKGVIEQSFEFILWLKAPEANWAKIDDMVQRLHPYDVPAIVAMPLTHVSSAYEAWAIENTES
ncbi:divalent-cation tolerance protein CutA [Hyphomonas polymorpha PS728]|uniref:Divalent-cation tolerance protein CutA n=1 Tax=Hyphomonas polymorpha PS728 TaxID=1280954 RepID=A0A062VAK2_9PROT|nr:divalent-cation tolerance protein CutA [Hyphomonas polymorpha]KCZ97210.1 divalent-cation tolerance protein CutA [Hyphomonas polymorpha PS728]